MEMDHPAADRSPSPAWPTAADRSGEDHDGETAIMVPSPWPAWPTAADRSGEDHDGETTIMMPSPWPAWPTAADRSGEDHDGETTMPSDLARLDSPLHRYYPTIMMGLHVAGYGNLQENQGEPTISAAFLCSPQAPSPPTMDVPLWSFIDRPISSPEELGPAPAEASHAGLLCTQGNSISEFIESISPILECNSRGVLSTLIITWERMIRFLLSNLTTQSTLMTCQFRLMTLSMELLELVCDAEDRRLTEISDMHYSNCPFRRSFPGRLRDVEQTSARLIMGCSSAEVDKAADKCSSSLGATTLLGIENPRQRQDKATASLSPLSSRKKIVKISNVKSHHHVSNESGGDNNEDTELGNKDVEADKPAGSVSRKCGRSQGRKSRAWLHFPNVEKNADNRITKAQCTYCGNWLEAGSKKDGTSRLLRHITDHHKMDLDASPETNKKRMALAIKTKNQPRYQTAANWGGIVPDKVPNEVSILDSQDSAGKISRQEGQLLDRINSASQEDILVPDEEEDDATTERDEYVLQRRAAGRNDVEDLDDIREVTAIAGSGPRRRPTTASRNTQVKEEKRLKRSARIEEIMERFPQMREEESARLANQAEEESARRAGEKEAAESNDFSIKRCISLLNTLEVTIEEKAKAYAVFSKSKENREVFICGCEADVESTLIWLTNEMV